MTNRGWRPRAVIAGMAAMLACLGSRADASELREGPLRVPPAPRAQLPPARFWPPVDVSSGLAVDAGFGAGHGGGLGLGAAYELALTRTLHLAPRLAAGAILLDDLPVLGYFVGAYLAVGRNHRLVLEAGWGSVAARRGSPGLNGQLGALELSRAASASAGYEYLAPFGLFGRALAGGGFDTAGPDRGAGRFVFSLALGVKVF